MFKYRIPQEIKTKFTKEIMTDFLAELIQIFDLKEPVFYSDDLFYLESTCGWGDAFEHICKKHRLEDVFAYYDNLEWYDSDLFDSEFGSLIIEYKLIEY